ncbi:MAG TPA: SDR family NAD(P)-dependent oxidoreductase [Actinospica sp.]|jgi:NAD(P)-dependent dehydrogenase (short-subunit alcohol dehydrogenase family)|nr:SDR family NAD(P)-dependent oxidoreductase [Actinospica sp.]
MTTHAPVRTPFTAASTAADVIAGVDLAGRRAVITGASSGIGTETARALASAGADVTLAVRSTQAGTEAAERITASTGNRRVRIRPLDLTSLKSVDAFAAGWDGPLHILVNNAGVMAPPTREVTADGVELQFAVNYLSHFALTLGLHPHLAGAGDARVVYVSSVGHLRSPVVFDDINFERRAYDPWLAYAQSKTAAALIVVAMTAHWAADGITANAVHPGGIRTNLLRYQGDAYLERLRAQYGSVDAAPWKSVEQGASTSVLAAASPLLKGVSGRYFEDTSEAEPATTAPTTSGVLSSGIAPWASDPQAAEELWIRSLAMTGRAHIG